jgi:two-component system, NarL family, nitrate/nitrite response regulator NarL
MAPATTALHHDYREPIRVLLVEDHEHVLWGLKKLIDGEWPRMVLGGAARTVSEALAALQGQRIDVVVLDIFLGSENALGRLPCAIASSGASLVVLTGERDPELHRDAANCGALAVVLKDEPAETLLRQIERAHRARHAAAAP